MESWKTTALGIFFALATLIADWVKNDTLTPTGITTALGLLGIGATAKDSGVYTKEAGKAPQDRSVSQNLPEEKK